MIRRIAILGSTGSIGTQTLDIIEEYPSKFRATLLTARNNASLLIEQAKKFRPSRVVIANENKYAEVKEALAPLGIDVASGSDAICEAVKADDIDIVVTAMVGYSGLKPTINAIKAGKDIALSNKETLVVAGELITALANEYKINIYPVDSEHSAIYQCLVGEQSKDINKLILTASGGPFRTWNKKQMEDITVAQALNHPNWSMGAKVTIDSASMMNKGFEIMEARWLFGIEADRIDVAVHPQSIVHSMVEFVDGSIKAQLGLPDMHLPIRYALGCPESRLKSEGKKLTIADYSHLTFEEPDLDRFPMLALAYSAINTGGNMPCALNAANEIAVAAFLSEKIKFMQIPVLVEKAIEATSYIKTPTYQDYVATNDEIRGVAEELI
ncbi:MAG: 1-deoxy-D-xylulose-5-phosphate reductoisomerase [Muribaculaceae bacterium]|nr:1-deoxy-D-xylulose-5-phosphate reductoisomerase [Muribaculaceae bacterium]